MRNAIDASYARPSPQDVADHQLDILLYTGNALPSTDYVSALRGLGVAVTLIQETTSTRSQSGYSAGVADSHYADMRADSISYPTTAAICYVVSDGSAGDPNSGGDNIAAYAKGVQDTSRRPFFFYGNRYAVDAAMRGAPKGLGCWVPSTWGATSSDLLIQEANMVSPIADTDLNTVHANYGAWGQEDDDMTPEEFDTYFFQPTGFGVSRFELYLIKFYSEHVAPTNGPSGQPATLLDWINIVEKANESGGTTTPSTGGISQAQVAAAVRTELDKTKLGT